MHRFLAVLLAASLTGPTPASAAEPAPPSAAGPAGERVSAVGEYRGWSEPRYEEWVRESLYLTMQDGVRLAADVLRPSVAGRPVAEPLPAVWTYHRYHRAVRQDGEVRTIADLIPALAAMLRHGYAVVSVDARGAGASFGVSEGLFAPVEARDGYEITEWIAAQPWCDGNVGMVGGSYLGITQYLTAGKAPPHLKALFPLMPGFDLYTTFHSGGVLREDLLEQWSSLVHRLDTEVPAPPVDADPGGELARQARAAHAANRDVADMFRALPLRDSQDEKWAWPYFVMSPFTWIDGVEASGVAVYHLTGWWDVFGREAFLWYAALSDSNPQKLVVGPWSHNQLHGLDATDEHLRWFDYWLKGIDNGIMDEPPIHYRPLGAGDEEPWGSLRDWPPPDAAARVFYFDDGRTGTVDSVNDGALAPRSLEAASAGDRYRVDYSTTSGKPSRYSNAYGDGGTDFSYPDMAANDARGLTYTGAPLTENLEVTGHPVVHLWVSSTAADGDFIVYLEEVDAEGVSHYVTEGVLRASHRALGAPPHPGLGLPYHRSMEEDLEPLPAGEPVELVLDLYPVSNVFDAGHRIRVTVTGADRANHDTPELDPPPVVTLHRGASHPSRVILPVVPPEAPTPSPSTTSSGSASGSWKAMPRMSK